MDEQERADIYESLTHIGWEWGVPLRQLIAELEQAGYRSYCTPTRKALDERLAVRCRGSRFHWSRERVGEFIEQRIGGKKPVVPRRCLVVPIVIE